MGIRMNTENAVRGYTVRKVALIGSRLYGFTSHRWLATFMLPGIDPLFLNKP